MQRETIRFIGTSIFVSIAILSETLHAKIVCIIVAALIGVITDEDVWNRLIS